MDTTATKTRWRPTSLFHKQAKAKGKTPEQYMQELLDQYKTQTAVSRVTGISRPAIVQECRRLGFEVERITSYRRKPV